MSNIAGFSGGLDGLGVLEDLYAPTHVHLCLKPGEHHPGPCPETGKSLIRKLFSPRSKAQAKTPAVVGHQRARGRDIVAELDMDTIGTLPKREGSSGRWRSGNHDPQLAAIAAVQGFDGPPNLVDREEFDRLKAARGALELYRGTEDNDAAGLSGDEIAALFRTGPIYYGQGWAGNGIYAAHDRAGALKYTTGDRESALNEMVLDPAARTVNIRDLRAEMDREIPEDTRARLEAVARAQQMAYKPGHHPTELIINAQAMKRQLQPQDWLWMDPSAFAMAKGYDAIYHGKEQRFPAGEWVLLNRTAVHTLVPPTPPRTLDELYPDRIADRIPAAVAVRERVEGCMPPHVPVPKPGPCPGSRKSPGAVAKKAARKIAGDTVEKTKAAPGRRKGGKNRPGRIAGQDLTGQLDYAVVVREPVGYKADRSDRQMSAIARAQGFDGLPSTGTPEQLDALKAAGGIELFRGMSHARDYETNRITKRAGSLVKEFKNGEAYFGIGDFGSGIYFSEDPSDMERYAEDGPSGMVRAVLSPDARIADYQVAFDGAAREGNSVEREARQRQMFKDLAGKTVPEKRAIRRAYNTWLEERPDREKVLGDMGRWAAANGYDAIRVTNTFPTGHTYVAILNRTALTTEP